MTIKSKRDGYVGNRPDFSKQEVATFVTDREILLTDFAKLGGLDGQPEHGGNWRPVVDGGMHYVDVRCARFMDALFWLNRARETTSHQIQYIGAATSAILSITQATKELLGIAPLGFGLADQTVNNIGQGLLYHLDPGTVAGLVARQQGTYRDAIKDAEYDNQAAALTVIQQYAALCLPVNIEGEVNRAIARSEFKRVDYRQVTPPVEEPEEEPVTAAEEPAAQPESPAAQPEEPKSSDNVNVIPVIEQGDPR
jgi:hypothetical protein